VYLAFPEKLRFFHPSTLNGEIMRRKYLWLGFNCLLTALAVWWAASGSQPLIWALVPVLLTGAYTNLKVRMNSAPKGLCIFALTSASLGSFWLNHTLLDTAVLAIMFEAGYKWLGPKLFRNQAIEWLEAVISGEEVRVEMHGVTQTASGKPTSEFEEYRLKREYNRTGSEIQMVKRGSIWEKQ